MCVYIIGGEWKSGVVHRSGAKKVKLRLIICVYLKVYFPATSLGFIFILSILTQTCRAGMPLTQAPSVLRSCSRTRAAPGAQRGDSQMGPAPEPRMKGDLPSLVAAAAAVWRPDSSLSAPTERWRASSAGLRGKYNDLI